jgi:hypothetical protein
MRSFAVRIGPAQNSNENVMFLLILAWEMIKKSEFAFRR